MVNEHDEQYGEQEEGEYHFSEDQTNYEMENELPLKATSSQLGEGGLVSKVRQYRRLIIGLVVFVVLMIIVYAMMPHTSGPIGTNITQATPKSVAPVATQPKSLVPVEAVNQQQQQPVQPVRQQPPQQPMQPVAAAPMQPQPINPAMSYSAVAPNVAAQPSVNPPQQAAPAAQVIPVGQSQPAPSPAGAPDNRSIGDRLAFLEQQDARMANFLQTEYAQKMADYAAQNSAMQSKIQDLNTRLSNMEASLAQLTQVLRGIANKQPSSRVATQQQDAATAYPPADRPAEPRMTYTVQAIIPGRAWLKSDAGDTVTVAEGDMLKDYGRVTKIDPYDGVVGIDTGSKTITLSYGNNTD